MITGYGNVANVSSTQNEIHALKGSTQTPRFMVEQNLHPSPDHESNSENRESVPNVPPQISSTKSQDNKTFTGNGNENTKIFP